MSGFSERMRQYRADAGLGPAPTDVPIIGPVRRNVYVVRFNSTAAYPKPFFNSYLSMLGYTAGHAPYPITIMEAEGGSALMEVARGNAILSAIQQCADYVIMLDIDQVYPPDTLVRMLRHLSDSAYGVIGSNIWKRQEPVCICAYDYDPGTSLYVSIADGHGPRGNFYVQALRDGNPLVAVDAVGAGCMGIDMVRCLGIPQPWFAPIETYGEDLSFCRRAQEHNVAVGVALDIEIGHLVQDAAVWPNGILRAVDREWVDARYIAALEQRLTQKEGG